MPDPAKLPRDASLPHAVASVAHGPAATAPGDSAPRGPDVVDPAAESARAAWHAFPAAHIAAGLAVALTHGLDDAEAAARRARWGHNRLPQPQRPSLLALLLRQLHSPLLYVLGAAALLALLLGDRADAFFILLVVALDAAIGVWQEARAERSAADLQRLLPPRARIRRGGAVVVRDAEDLVPGDVVLVESGNRVPADLRLHAASDLAIDEAPLTGESTATNKADATLPAATPVADRRCMAFAGTTVQRGRGEGVVVATGARTEVGGIASAVAATKAQTPPLVLRMQRFARHVSVAVVAASLVVAAVSLLRGQSAHDVFFLAVALAVSAIPEGLPVAVTVALSIATQRMSKRGVIVRRLPAVEGLGSCSLIASDKTGTLTVNRQTVRRVALPGGEHVHVGGEGYAGLGAVTTDTGEPLAAAVAARVHGLAAAAVPCSEATLTPAAGEWTHEGDPVDVALLAFAHKAGVAPAVARGGGAVLARVPFESERAFAAACVQQGDGGRVVCVKGALERLLPRCASMRTADGVVPVDRALLEQQAHELASSGHRFLLVATAAVAAGAPTPFAGGDDALPPLTVEGLVGFLDPPRPRAKDAIARCHAAGVAVVMVTGDHPRTSFAIARELGLADDERQIVTGSQLAAADDDAAVDALCARGRVFARIAPLQKLQLVRSFQRLGHVVAVTGDGVNDAPALRAADIGVAMGSGADVAKDTAPLLLTDDDLASLAAGIEQGRYAYDTIRKVGWLLLATGLAEMLTLLAAVALGLPAPLTALQLLWLNLVTNGIQDVALAFEGGEPAAMQRPPRRKDEGFFDRTMLRQVALAGGAMAALGVGYWWWLLDAGHEVGAARNQLLVLFVLLENAHVLNCRSERSSAFAVPWSRNVPLAVAVPLAFGVHLLAMHTPWLQGLLGMAPLSVGHWLEPLALAGVLLVVVEAGKALRRRGERRAAGAMAG
jgi:magnesium-transporting ATPase (P-type)